MLKLKTIINTQGEIVDFCVGFKNNEAQNFIMQDNYEAVDLYTHNYIKPKWNGSKWIEGATEEEIKAWQEENKGTKEITTEEKLIKEMANLKVDNMKKDTVISNLIKTVAELKIKIMNVEEGK